MKVATLRSLAIASLALCAFSSYAYAARFYISHDINNAQVGDVKYATIYVDSEGDTINNGEATVTFPTDKVRVESVSISGSIFSLWVEQPAFSNQSGTISFNGGAPNPGFYGSRGKVLQVTFRTLAPGSGQLAFGNSSILSNDGFGTDVAKQPASSGFTISSPTPQPVKEEPKKEEPETSVEPSTTTSLSTPVITSKDILGNGIWHNRDSATFTWTVPQGVRTVLTSLDGNRTGTPKKEYTPPISSRQLSDFDDGKQYLHVQFVGTGVRSPVGTFEINIDTTPPENLRVTHSVSEKNTPVLTISASDDTSGVSHYLLTIDNRAPERILNTGDTKIVYLPPALAPGEHIVSVQAFDKANNNTESKITFSTTALKAPIITDYPRSLSASDTLSISGKSEYTQSLVKIWVTEDGKRTRAIETMTDDAGGFSLTKESVEALKLITAYAEIVADKDNKSPTSNEIRITIQASKNTVLWVIGFIILIVVLGYIVYMRIQIRRLKLRRSLDLSTVDIDADLESISASMKNYAKVLKSATRRQHMTHQEEVELLHYYKQLVKSHKEMIKKMRDSKLAGKA